VRVHLDVSLGTLWSDGTPQVHSALVNGTSPGPALRFQLGDFILVNVTNSLEYANTTIHWHGLSMMLTPLVDGVPLVTQWPIAPNRWFEYGFKAEQVGEHWLCIPPTCAC
jgi:FtsP/CotA-like multicopper oxidase with cupredoxin domain